MSRLKSAHINYFLLIRSCPYENFSLAIMHRRMSFSKGKMFVKWLKSLIRNVTFIASLNYLDRLKLNITVRITLPKRWNGGLSYFILLTIITVFYHPITCPPRCKYSPHLPSCFERREKRKKTSISYHKCLEVPSNPHTPLKRVMTYSHTITLYQRVLDSREKCSPLSQNGFVTHPKITNA